MKEDNIMVLFVELIKFYLTEYIQVLVTKTDYMHNFMYS